MTTTPRDVAQTISARLLDDGYLPDGPPKFQSGFTSADLTTTGPDGIVWTIRVSPAPGQTPQCHRHTGMAAHDGYVPHSHEVRPDHGGVQRQG